MENRFPPVIARKRASLMKQSSFFPAAFWIASLSLAMTIPNPAAAQVPGDVCATAQQYKVNGGPETLGLVHMMVCEGGTWKSIVSSNAAGEVTKIGNQTCANGDYFKYDGTKLICATGVSGAIDDLTDAYTDYTTLNNIILGRAGAAALTAGAQYNLFIGQSAGATSANSTAATDHNVGLGHSALAALTSGSSNVALGYGGLQRLTSGASNIAIGHGALAFNLTGIQNVAIGTSALLYATAGNNTAVGYNAGGGSFTVTTGLGNAFFGSVAGVGNTSGSYNVAVGGSALQGNKAKSESTAVGYGAMQYADDTATSAITYNTAVGAYALQGSTTAANNTGTRNTALGHSALIANTSGGNNTAIGQSALLSNTTAGNSTAVGYGALRANTTGGPNTGIGTEALYLNVTGINNTALGYRALYNNTSANNVAIGHLAGDNITTGSSNILIGASVDTPAATDSNHLNIGNTIFGDLSTDNVRVGGSGLVGAGPFIAAPPASEAIAGAATITANACGSIKQISATGSQTTNTTDTFTAPTASYAGCCMDVVNIDTVDTITLDQNAKFFTGPGTDLALGPGKAVRVCSDGTSWYQAASVTSVASGGNIPLSGLTAAIAANSINNADYEQTWNWQVTTADKDAFTFTENIASTATGHSSILKAATLPTSTATPLMVTNLGAAASFRVNDETGDADTTPFVIDASGNVGIGTATPHASAKLDVRGALFLDSDNSGSLGDIYSGPVWPYSINVGWDGQNSRLRFNAVGTAGGTADFRDLWVYDGKTALVAQWEGSTKRFATGGDDSTPDAMLEVIKNSTSPLLMLSSAAANNGDLMIVDTNGKVGIGTASPAQAMHIYGGAQNTYALVATDADRESAIAFSELPGSYYASIGYDGNNDLFAIRTSTGTSLAALTTRLVINRGNGNVGIGTTSPASKLVVAPPASEAIAGAAIITADACGTIKQITSTGNVTTNTTNTFTAPTASYAGCCMDVVNVDTGDTITLDANTLFKTIGGANQALGPDDAVRVCSNGTNWYQVGAVSGNQ